MMATLNPKHIQIIQSHGRYFLGLSTVAYRGNPEALTRNVAQIGGALNITATLYETPTNERDEYPAWRRIELPVAPSRQVERALVDLGYQVECSVGVEFSDDNENQAILRD